jgi:hypothetical protein
VISGRRTALNAIAFGWLGVYLLLAAVSFFTFVEPALNGANGWHFNSDTQVYMNVADSMRDQGTGAAIVALMSLARNLILPGLVALMLRTPANIAVFNLLVFIAALVLLARTFSHFKWHVFLPIVLASPNTYEALLTLNKEIFVFLSAVVLARWFKTRSAVLMVFLILLSVVLRWEQALVIICFWMLVGLKVAPKRAAVAMIIGISLAYPFAMASVDVGGDITQSSSSAFFAEINLLQSYGLYFALLVPKLIITLLSQIVRFWVPFIDTIRLHDLTTGLFVLFEQICMCVVVIVSCFKKLWVKENPVIYFVLVYAVIFLAAPENSPRYLYMIFVLMAVVLSSPELQTFRLSGPATVLPKRQGLVLSRNLARF